MINFFFLQKPDEKMGARFDEAYVKNIQDDIRLAVRTLETIIASSSVISASLSNSCLTNYPVYPQHTIL